MHIVEPVNDERRLAWHNHGRNHRSWRTAGAGEGQLVQAHAVHGIRVANAPHGMRAEQAHDNLRLAQALLDFMLPLRTRADFFDIHPHLIARRLEIPLEPLRHLQRIPPTVAEKNLGLIGGLHLG